MRGVGGVAGGRRLRVACSITAPAPRRPVVCVLEGGATPPPVVQSACVPGCFRLGRMGRTARRPPPDHSDWSGFVRARLSGEQARVRRRTLHIPLGGIATIRLPLGASHRLALSRWGSGMGRQGDAACRRPLEPQTPLFSSFHVPSRSGQRFLGSPVPPGGELRSFPNRAPNNRRRIICEVSEVLGHNIALYVAKCSVSQFGSKSTLFRRHWLSVDDGSGIINAVCTAIAHGNTELYSEEASSGARTVSGIDACVVRHSCHCVCDWAALGSSPGVHRKRQESKVRKGIHASYHLAVSALVSSTFGMNCVWPGRVQRGILWLFR